MRVRLLCVDLGDKRTGLAVGDVVMRISSPVGVLEVPIAQREGAALIESILKAVAEHGAGVVVFGLPLNMDGTEGPRAKMVRAFAARVASAARPGDKGPGIEVRFQDERLTSSQADWQMARSGMTRGEKKSKRDALAAAVILKDHLEGLSRT